MWLHLARIQEMGDKDNAFKPHWNAIIDQTNPCARFFTSNSQII
jgi:hypothetical protein